jgi:hypothetical protein
MKAWIIRWNWIGEHAAVERPLVNILSARASGTDVCKYIERVYASSHYSVAEKLAMAQYNKPSKAPYPARFDAIDGHAYPRHISCGHNPFVEAFLADGVEVADTALGVIWDEKSIRQARSRFREATAKFKLDQVATQRKPLKSAVSSSRPSKI